MTAGAIERSASAWSRGTGRDDDRSRGRPGLLRDARVRGDRVGPPATRCRGASRPATAVHRVRRRLPPRRATAVAHLRRRLEPRRAAGARASDSPNCSASTTGCSAPGSASRRSTQCAAEMSRLKGGGLAALAGPRPGLALHDLGRAGDDPARDRLGPAASPARRATRCPAAMPAEVAEVLARCAGARAVPRRCRVSRCGSSPRIAMPAQRRRQARVPGPRGARGPRRVHGRRGRPRRALRRARLRLRSGTRLGLGRRVDGRVAGAARTRRAQPAARPRRGDRASRAGCGVTLLAAGTDGVDGATDDAGAMVDETTCARGAQARARRRANTCAAPTPAAISRNAVTCCIPVRRTPTSATSCSACGTRRA